MLPLTMQAIDYQEFGPPSVLSSVQIELPKLRETDLLVQVKALGVNRADLNQRQGKYGKNPTFGDSPLLGLEIAGVVVDLGAEVSGFKIGDRVMGIVGGGAYAQYARIDAGMATHIPSNMSDIEAAGVTEAFVTAHQALLHLGRFSEGETVLIHGAGGGVGCALIQMALQSGAGMVITTSSSAKIDRLRNMGVHLAIDYASEDFREIIAEKVPGGGVDVIIDIMGGDYLERNIRSLNIGGRIIQIGMQGERSGTLPMDLLLQRRLRIEGTVMKSVSLQEKRNMTNRFQARWLSDLESKKIVPVIDKSFPLAEAALAHEYMQEAKNFGKIILIPSSC